MEFSSDGKVEMLITVYIFDLAWKTFNRVVIPHYKEKAHDIIYTTKLKGSVQR